MKNKISCFVNFPYSIIIQPTEILKENYSKLLLVGG